MNKQVFIEEAENFFKKNNLDYELRDNVEGVCKFISPETITILFYDGELDLSINIHFEKKIDFEIEHYNSFKSYMEYDMNIFRCKLSMMLEYIHTHEKLKVLESQLKSSKLDTKWKTKMILEKLDENN